MSFIKFLQKLFGGKPSKPKQEVVTASGSFNLNGFGFNTGFSFIGGLEGFDEYIEAVKDIKINTLRFPGGTNSQYYHPYGTGYGIIRDEVVGKASIAIANLFETDKKEKENYVYHFIRLAKLHPEAKIILDLNLLTGFVDEALTLIDIIEDNGLKVYGVELGNELYFPVYRSYIADVYQYIGLCKIYSSVIRKTHPEIKISVCVGNMVEFDVPEGRKVTGSNTWNNILAKEDFYDAISIHTYIGKEDGNNSCDTVGNIDKRFDCYKNLLSPVKNNPCGVIVGEAQKLFGNKPIWLSEWNSGKPGLSMTNTVLHGMFVLEMLINMSENRIELSHFHNISSVGPAYGSLFRNNRSANLLDTEIIVRSTAHFAFKFFSETKGNRVDFPEVPDIVIRVYEHNGKGVMLFVNKSFSNHFISVAKWKNVKVRCVKGTSLHSTGGRSPIKSDLAEYVTLFDSQVLPAYSFGVINYDVDK